MDVDGFYFLYFMMYFQYEYQGERDEFNKYLTQGN